MADPKVSWVRERCKNWILFGLNRLKATHPEAISWWDPENPKHVAACERLGANLSILFASFLEKAKAALPNPAARADLVLQAMANLLREDAVWWDPEPENTIPE